jgi:hypothetical protein
MRTTCMSTFLPPPVVFQGTRWSTETLTGMAAAWRRSLGASFLLSPRPHGGTVFMMADDWG